MIYSYKSVKVIAGSRKDAIQKIIKDENKIKELVDNEVNKKKVLTHNIPKDRVTRFFQLCYVLGLNLDGTNNIIQKGSNLISSFVTLGYNNGFNIIFNLNIYLNNDGKRISIPNKEFSILMSFNIKDGSTEDVVNDVIGKYKIFNSKISEFIPRLESIMVNKKLLTKVHSFLVQLVKKDYYSYVSNMEII